VSDLALAAVSHRALLDAVAQAVVVTDGDGRIVLWSHAAEQLYGWHEHEVLGLSIVDLLVPEEERRGYGDDVLERLASADLDDDHRLLTRDGTTVEVHTSARALRAPDGTVVAVVGLSYDLREVRAGEVATAAVADRLRHQLELETRRALLAEATSDLAVSLSVTESLERLADLVVPELADLVIIDLADEDRRPVQVAMLHRDGMEDVVERFSALQPTMLTDQAPIMRILAGEPARLVSHATIANATTFVTDRELLDLCDQLGIVSAMYVPLIARDRVLGCITLVSGRSGRHYDEDDLAYAQGLAQRAALVVDNSSLFEREHHIAEVLQHSLLATVPTVPGLEIAGLYLPSDQAAQVGGDFYDVLVLADGSAGLSVGDVVGHDLGAAAAMGQLRGLLRACAWESGEEGAGAVVDRLDRLVQALGVTPLATVLYLQVGPRPEGGGWWDLQWATAGHPAPLLRHPDGVVRELDASGLVLGVGADTARRPGATTVAPGSVLVAFTDGLVERRDEQWEVGLGRIRSTLADAPSVLPPALLADRLAAAAGGNRADDTAMLVVRFA
jgi:PAS domain S-box-containing protein